MNEYSIVVDFQKGNIYTDLSVLVQNDYNAYKLNFEFDKEFERALFKLKYPVDDKEWVQDIVDNQLTLPVLKDTGDYEYEVSIYSEDGRLTGYATEKFHVRSELINTDDIVESDDRVPVLDNLINETTQLKNETTVLKEEVEEAIEETNNLNIDVSDKINKDVNITLTKKDKTAKTVTLSDGTSLMFEWRGTYLGVKTDKDEEYTYVNLQGKEGKQGPMGAPFRLAKTYSNITDMIADYDNMNIGDFVNIKASVEQEDNSKIFTKGETEDPIYRWLYLGDFSGATGIQGPVGATPNIQIGTVTSGTTPSVTRTGTNENPVFNFVLEPGKIGPQGETGATGQDGVSPTATVTETVTGAIITITDKNGTTTADIKNGEVTEEQLDVVQSEIDKYKTISNLLPKVEGEGTDITLNNTVDGVTMDITPEGATSQYTTTGKNLVDYSTCVVGDITQTGIEQSSQIRIRSDFISVNASTNYVCSLVGGEYTAFFYDSSKNFISGGTQWFSSGTSFETPNNTAYVRLKFRKSDNSDISLSDLSEVQLEEGSTVTNFEEYTGGQPSPSPDYPQPIKVVTGEQNVNVHSRNLFEIKTPNYTGQGASNGYGGTNYIKLDNGYRFPDFLNAIAFKYNDLIPGEQYTISFNYITKSNVQNYFNVGNNVYKGYSGSDTSYKAFYARTTSQKGILTFTASTTNRIAFDSGYTNGMQLEITNIQLEKSPTATDFVPYYNKDYPLSLGNIELAEITENYQDYIYGTPNNWYKYKYIQKVVFDGTEEWSKLVENTNTVQFIVRSGIPEKAKGLYNAMSDLFKTYSGSVEEECITGQSNNTGLQIIINKTIANTKEDFKTWLSTHNVTAYYELNTPTTEQITDTTLIEQLNNLYNATSAQGITYITCSSASDDNETLQVKASTYKDISSILNPVVESEGE